MKASSGILQKACVPLGRALMGEGMVAYILPAGSDGYQVVSDPRD
jgi:hypothetical protein